MASAAKQSGFTMARKARLLRYARHDGPYNGPEMGRRSRKSGFSFNSK